MNIKTLEISNFRNYSAARIDLSDGINILYGNNAQGKTNILEALYVGSTTKSQKGSKEKEMINFNAEEAHVRIILEKKSMDYRIDMHLRRNRSKGVAVNGFPIKKSSELYGIVNIISFSPDDLAIIKQGPSERRKFMDMELCQLDKLYLFNLSNYNHVLVQRNNLLKQLVQDKNLRDTLDVWDEQLIKYGEYIISSRIKFVNGLNYIIKDIHNKLSMGKEEIKLNYAPDITIERFSEQLFFNRDKDIFSKSTCTGPHRDDMEFIINGENIRKFGSQGQQRTAALSLKLSEIEIVKQKIGDSPILLLDDVLSELDRDRQNQLLESISQTQTIITCTGLEEFINKRISCDTIYKVTGGTVEKIIDHNKVEERGKQ